MHEMESILDVRVSCFANYFTPINPVDINLLTWLKSEKYKKEVLRIRQESSREVKNKLKAALPAITPSGTFSIRQEKDLIKHNNFIQFDIDLKENQHLGNFYHLKDQICNIHNVAYCSQSVSGNGFWGLIPIAFPSKHKQHFQSLQNVFKHLGIVIDEKPKNVASLRGYTWDPEPYFNHNALTFQLFERYEMQNIRETFGETVTNTTSLHKVNSCVNDIVRLGIDLTTSYDAWFKIGCSLANTFGEQGRDIYHTVSQFHSRYKPWETDKQFTRCLNMRNNSYSIATFLDYCNKVGVKYK
jgi:hypothetical protein